MPAAMAMTFLSAPAELHARPRRRWSRRGSVRLETARCTRSATAASRRRHHHRGGLAPAPPPARTRARRARRRGRPGASSAATSLMRCSVSSLEPLGGGDEHGARRARCAPQLRGRRAPAELGGHGHARRSPPRATAAARSAGGAGSGGSVDAGQVARVLAARPRSRARHRRLAHPEPHVVARSAPGARRGPCPTIRRRARPRSRRLPAAGATQPALGAARRCGARLPRCFQMMSAATPRPRRRRTAGTRRRKATTASASGARDGGQRRRSG